MRIIIGTFSELKDTVMPIRHEVFYEEQGIPEGVMHDEYNEIATQCAVYAEGRPVATARIFETDGVFFIGQVATLASERGKGYGSAAVNALIDWAKEREILEVQVHAQTTAARFYEKHGFIAFGEPYFEGRFKLVDMKRTS
jgi:predicted GNAT family N-acyltransferase